MPTDPDNSPHYDLPSGRIQRTDAQVEEGEVKQI